MKRNNSFALRYAILALLLISIAGAASIGKQVETTNVYLTVRDFGAIGDGETDDTKAFQWAGRMEIAPGSGKVTNNPKK